MTFIAKFGVHLAFLCTYTASFSNDKIFPVSIRTSAIGQCQLIGRMLTVFASEVTELPKPQPMGYFCILSVIAIGVSFTFDVDDETIDNDKQKEETMESSEKQLSCAGFEKSVEYKKFKHTEFK